jgi:bifunctional non-homologous end joining protein LigD
MLPADGARWEYQLKLDGYRAVAFRTGGRLHLRSRNDNDFSRRYPSVLKGLAQLPDETVIDGEIVAID